MIILFAIYPQWEFEVHEIALFIGQIWSLGGNFIWFILLFIFGGLLFYFMPLLYPSSLLLPASLACLGDIWSSSSSGCMCVCPCDCVFRTFFFLSMDLDSEFLLQWFLWAPSLIQLLSKCPGYFAFPSPSLKEKRVLSGVLTFREVSSSGPGLA